MEKISGQPPEEMKDLFLQTQIAKDYHEEKKDKRRREYNLIEEGKLKQVKTKKK